MTGKHLIADIRNISNVELLKTLDGIEPLMKKIIQEVQLNVVGEIHKQFKPVGATSLYLLAESHLSAHSYPEFNYLAIDLYHCSNDINMTDVLEIIYDYFNGDCTINKTIINR
jgi:S-adenosylmethionine decarboxylase proenzyme